MPSKQKYDYIILGAGSAGCVLADKLSADGQSRVLVLEAGPMDHNLLIHIPAGVYSVYRDPSINWNYKTDPEIECNNREINMPRGKVIGGSSSINSMVYMRGHPLDYDRWAEKFNLPQWRFEHCLPYFKAEENSERGANDWHGNKGPLGVSLSKTDNPLYDAMIEAGRQSGQGNSEDLNGYKPEGIARLDSTTKGGRRCSTATAYLKPALRRTNLELQTRVLVEKIVIENNRAVGVQIRQNGTVKTIHAVQSVIVSCGALKSPQLLMLSGIGPADHLREHGIDPVVNLPGVGQNLQDHLAINTAFECKLPVTWDYLTNPFHKMCVGINWLLTRRGIASSNIWEMGGLVSGNTEVDFPNLQYHFAPVHNEYKNGRIKLIQGYKLMCDQLRPKSKGQIRLQSTDPSDRPSQQFNYLSDPHDMREMIEATKKMDELMSQPAFDKFRGKRINPAPDIHSDREIEADIRDIASTEYHPCGTCRMGSDDMAVVDGEMNIHGIEGLRVVDASTMPDIVSGNLNAPTIMMAARAADFILGNKPLTPERPSFHFDKKNNN